MIDRWQPGPEIATRGREAGSTLDREVASTRAPAAEHRSGLEVAYRSDREAASQSVPAADCRRDQAEGCRLVPEVAYRSGREAAYRWDLVAGYPQHPEEDSMRAHAPTRTEAIG